jgi:hypothetical protein
MNNARLLVGIQGLAIAERAYQQAADFARARVQSKEDGSADPTPVAIVKHADVRRTLMTMRAKIEAMRALGYCVAAGVDTALKLPNRDTARTVQDRVDLLIPIMKAWSTDLGNEIASMGLQVHGGMGFIEETGAAQHLRDARILPIYEGTNGVQARDLVSRKVPKDDGQAMRRLIDEIWALTDEMEKTANEHIAAIRDGIMTAANVLGDATEWMVKSAKTDPQSALAGSTPYLNLAGAAIGGWLLAKGALAAHGKFHSGSEDSAFLEAKIITARFYVEVILPPELARIGPLKDAGRTVFSLTENQF